MELTQKQQEGLEIILDRFKRKERFSVISGYAGTGKTTLVKFIVAALQNEFNIKPKEDICYAAYTGKACQVLQKKGNKPVCTLHRLLWEFKPIGEKKFRRERIFPLPYKIVIVDECSMVDADILKELGSHFECHFIFLGDPGQLPPVQKDKQSGQTGYDLLQQPHIFLNEVMRQAQESEIIRLSMDVRAGKNIPFYKGTEVQVISRNELTTGHLTWADQIICGTNATRIALNNQIRELMGFGENPEDGDRLICLRNSWDDASLLGEPLVNGSIGFLDTSYQSFIRPPFHAPVPVICGNIKIDDEDYYVDLIMDKKSITDGEYGLDWKTYSKLMKNPKTRAMGPLEFTYGYAITCHKSQGSEWDKVLIYEEKFPFDKEEHKRWLYTACTRASQKLVLVRP